MGKAAHIPVTKAWDDALAAVKAMREQRLISARCHVLLRLTGDQGSWEVVSVHARACCKTTLRVRDKSAIGYVAHVDADGAMCCFVTAFGKEQRDE